MFQLPRNSTFTKLMTVFTGKLCFTAFALGGAAAIGIMIYCDGKTKSNFSIFLQKRSKRKKIWQKNEGERNQKKSFWPRTFWSKMAFTV